MALTDYMYPPDLPKEQYNNFGLQQLLGTIQGIAQASQPSRLKVQPSQIIAGGLGGALQGSNNAMGQMALMQKIKDEQVKAKMLQDAQAQQAAFRREVSGIPQTSIIEDQANQRSTQVQRPLQDYLGDVAKTAFKYDPYKGAEMYKDLGLMGGKGQFSTAHIIKDVNGQKHYFTMDPSTGKYDVDQGPVPPEEYKTGMRQAIVFRDGRVVDSLFDPSDKKLKYYDVASRSLKEVDQPYTPANMLLSSQDAANLGLPYGTTKGEAAVAGPSSVNPTMRQTLSAFEQSKNILDDMEKYSQKVNIFNAGPAGFNRLYNASVNTIGAKLQTNPDAKALESKGGELSNIIRAMGEKGTLAEGDVNRGLMLIPTIGDTRTVAQNKLKDLRLLFSKNKAALSSSLTAPINTRSKKTSGKYTIETVEE